MISRKGKGLGLGGGARGCVLGREEKVKQITANISLDWKEILNRQQHLRPETHTTKTGKNQQTEICFYLYSILNSIFKTEKVFFCLYHIQSCEKMLFIQEKYSEKNIQNPKAKSGIPNYLNDILMLQTRKKSNFSNELLL